MSDDSTVKVEHDALLLGPVRVTFQRTLRIAERGLHDLPPGLGAFPVRRVEDYPDTAPAEWWGRGGGLLPVYQREAMWLSFSSHEPAALQVGVGKVCAISGEAWSEELGQDPQNYAALPEQPWLDGINAGDGFIRQFVAVAHGLGASVEGQITGQEVHGGVQLRAVAATEQAMQRWRAEEAKISASHMTYLDGLSATGALADMMVGSMGLGAGGQMRQEIYEDERGLTDYDGERPWRVFVHLCSAAQWTAITGETPPPTPVDRESYVEFGLPWFDYYDADREDVTASEALAKVKATGAVLGHEEVPYAHVAPASVIKLKHQGGDPFAPGTW